MSSRTGTKATKRSKRTNNACERCRKRKIKCSGDTPCVSCRDRGHICTFASESKKVMVSQEYLQELERIADRKHYQREYSSTPRELAESVTQEESPHIYENDNDNGMANPLVSITSTYLPSNDGRLRSLGESSTWSLSRKTLTYVRNHLNEPESPEIPSNAESRAYKLAWTAQKNEDSTNFSHLPSIDHALFLTNGVKFHLGQLFHLFDNDEFTQNMHEFYESPSEKTKSSRIWFVQFLSVLALGKATLSSAHVDPSSPPGGDLFLEAMSLLPDPSSLFDKPLTSIETLCIIALYLQSADERNSAFIYIGQALRMAIVFGLHRQRHPSDWDPHVVERCHRIWWTVYILDRTFTSSQGVPLTSINDNDITIPLPTTELAPRSTALYVHVKLARVTGEVIKKIYSVDGHLGVSFLSGIQLLLKQIASITNDLNEFFPLAPINSAGSVSRVAAHLHLYYHQAILITLYPLVFCLFQERIREQNYIGGRIRRLSETSRALLQSGFESCDNMLRIISALQHQGLLQCSLPFDLEYVFAASFSMKMISVILPSSQVDSTDDLRASLALEHMVVRGSIPARFRKSELDLLDSLLGAWKRRFISTDRDSDMPQNSVDLLPLGVEGVHGPSGVNIGDLGDIDTAQDISPGHLLHLARMANESHAEAVRDQDWLDSWLWATENIQ